MLFWERWRKRCLYFAFRIFAKIKYALKNYCFSWVKIKRREKEENTRWQ